MKKLLSLFMCLITKVVLLAQPLPLDYSYCGYRQSEFPIPDMPNSVYVSPQDGDCSAVIQDAIDYVSALRPDKRTGFRGAVLLGEGVYEIASPLFIRTSGVVVRGSGRQQTVLLRRGVDRRAAVYIEGIDDRLVTDTFPILQSKVESGALRLKIFGNLSAGDQVQVWRPSPLSWIQHLGCEVFGGGKELGYWGWHEGDIDLYWDRRIVSVENNETITLNAPITTSLESQYGGGKVLRYRWPGRINNCGVENLSIVSDYAKNNPYDEDHCWNGIYISSAVDCWVRMVDFRHLAGSAVVVQPSGTCVTIEDCRSYSPVSELGGMRRRTFYLLGGQCLVQRCYAEDGINDFVAGFCAPGPNAFVQCEAKRTHGFSGSIGSWASGLLFDCVTIDGHDLKFCNLELEKYGAGWNTANSLMWQCAASGLYCYQPDADTPNMAVGCWGQMWGNGEWRQPNEHVKPWSIFQSQLSERLGRNVDDQCRILNRLANDATSSPTIEQAIQLAAESSTPLTTMEEWIDSAVFVPSVNSKGVKAFKRTSTKKDCKHIPRYQVLNGCLVADDVMIVGGKHDSPWWNGRLRYSALPKATYALTRFVPGMEGSGTTDRIDSVVVTMVATHTRVYAQNYGLWYDRRRDDHERVRRADGDVWGPFYEQPFARSGQDKAWDGLSRYDLLQDNRWYMNRLTEFAEKSASFETVLLYEHYFQHNILEAGAHWVDCPWRSVNNINHTTFPEPVPFSGDKRIFTAHLFYDTNDTVLSHLHRAYIRRQLDAFRGCPNVIHSIGAEFTGPLSFVRFWIDCIQEWCAETGEKPLVMLKATKDVQDSILVDPIRSRAVDIIAIEQWYYHDKGLYAPEGGVNMAPRQYLRKIKVGNARFDEVYHSVSEYRRLYPDKAVVYYGKNYPEQAWAAFMGGGSLAAIPVTDSMFLKAAASMRPVTENGCYLLRGEKGCIVMGKQGNKIELPYGAYYIYEVDMRSGAVSQTGETKTSEFTLLHDGVCWLRRK